MSELPLPPLEPQFANPSSRLSPIISWVIILLCVAGFIMVNALPGPRGRAQATGSDDLQMLMMGKYIVGVNALLPAHARPLIQELEGHNKTFDDKICIIAVVGEVEGGEAAIRRLQKLDRELAVTSSPVERVLQHIYADDISALLAIYKDGPAAVTPHDRIRLAAQYGYFGNLALSYQLPDSDALRRSVLNQARRLVIALITVLILGGLAALAGLVLFIVAIVLRADGKIRSLYVRPPRGQFVYVEMFAIYLGLMVAFLLLEWVAAMHLGLRPALWWAWALSIILPIVIGWALWRGVGWNELRMALGWHAGRGIHVEIPLGIVGFVAGLPIVIVGFVITYALMKMSHLTPTHPITGESVDSIAQVLQLYAIACIWAPVMEETMFRGALFHHLRGRWGWLISAGVVSLIFAAIHPQGWTTIPVLGAIAIVLAGLREWRGSILPSMTAHAFSNFVVVSLLVAMK